MDFYLVTYDIPNDKRRNKVASLLEDYGKRVQFSVFEAWLDQAQQRTLLQQLKGLIEAKEDSVRLYQLCANCQKRVLVLGVGQISEQPGPIII